MTIKESLQRIHWRTSSGNAYKPNEKDIEAVNFLVEWVSKEKEKTLQQNQLFAKLYIIYFGELLLHYRDVEFAQKQINDMLSKSTNEHVFWFRQFFNEIEFSKIHTSLGLSKKHPALLSDIENEKEKQIIEENQKLLLENINKWDEDKIRKSLENQITEAYQKYKNHV